MIYRRRRRLGVPNGVFRFENVQRRTLTGYGENGFVRLRDEYGNVWLGMAEREDDDLIRYRLRDENGQVVTGISDSYGVVLRDEKGRTWRGTID